MSPASYRAAPPRVGKRKVTERLAPLPNYGSKQRTMLVVRPKGPERQLISVSTCSTIRHPSLEFLRGQRRAVDVALGDIAPVPAQRLDVSRSSTPSATRSASRLCASATVDHTMAMDRGSLASRATKTLSSLSSSTERSWRRANDHQPVPYRRARGGSRVVATRRPCCGRAVNRSSACFR